MCVCVLCVLCVCVCLLFFQAEDGIRDLVRSRGLGDVYKRQVFQWHAYAFEPPPEAVPLAWTRSCRQQAYRLGDHAWGLQFHLCLLYTSDAADERSSVDLGGRRIIKKKNTTILTQERKQTSKKQEKKKLNNTTTNRE